MIKLLEVRKHKYKDYRSVVFDDGGSNSPHDRDLKVHQDGRGTYFMISKYKVYFDGCFSTLPPKPKMSREQMDQRKALLEERRQARIETQRQAREKRKELYAIAERRKDLFIRFEKANNAIRDKAVNSARNHDFDLLEKIIKQLEELCE